MLNVADFCFELQKNDIGFFCGVPDSLLKSFCAFISDNYPEDKNVITANEGNAIALASGYYLATGKIGCVYMQNSGLGNCVNPLLSLADKDVYGIPMLLIIGWRGEPNVKDEPQHIKQGQVTLSLLDAMEIEYRVLENMSDISTLVRPLNDENDINNPNLVKCVRDLNGFALYFSRSKIPYERNSGIAQFWGHLGIYGYKREALIKMTTLPQSPLEKTESLEQLRALENGMKIKTSVVDFVPVGIDTADDLEKFRKIASSLL